MSQINTNAFVRPIKTLVLLIALFPTTTFAESKEEQPAQPVAYDREIQKLNEDSDSIAAQLLARRTATGTNRAPASEGFQVTLIRKK